MTTDPSDEQEAADIAAVLMRHALDGGPLIAVRRLTRLLRILRIVTRVITAERDRQAHAIGAIWPQRRAAELVGVKPSTMQRWMESGRDGKGNSIGESDDAE
jgi:hypothetical protein